ncbi:MAG: 2-oxoacid:acceptor oxidoreductase subunit alpha [Euzebyales bacterium]|nr:2-oxoacid:acceptor oxidoreductase subunit alpha [Euzebyales bacterium]MBA3621875.1 2-oxoacid:acceptor oxidoreductase subunit alpha [Euzebyales bacterium]
MSTKTVQRLDTVTIRFAGDSGDGMQLTGNRFTSVTAAVGNDLATLPDFPAEIRAPAGSLPGVSGFQLHFADHDILTPGDAPDVLVAMNPAALKTNLGDLVGGGTLVVNSDAFTRGNLKKAAYGSNPLEDDSLAGYQVFSVPITTLTVGALEDSPLSSKDKQRAKNMFALGLMSWMYSRPTEPTEAWLRDRFGRDPELADANIAAFRAGWAFGETTEVFTHTYEVPPARLPPGRYRQITGNQALAYGLIAAAERSGLPLFLGSYPITPASDVLHELSRHKHFGIRTFQAEDEIAGIGAALGAAFAGNLAVTTTSGPGVALKGETIGLAVSVELPLLIVNIQRGGPSTGLPTKTEQSDLLQAMYGRNGEAPVPIVAAAAPGDCFDAVLEAARIAITYRTPVFLLSDGYLANGAEPWRLPEVDDLPDLSSAVGFTTEANHDGEFWPFERDPDTLARPWAIPGTPGLEHRIGGLEKADGTGNISYDPDNHHRMTELRAAKVAGIARDIPPLEVDDAGEGARLLVVGWGSSYGPIRAAVRKVRAQGHRVDRAHLRHLNPFPLNTGEVLSRYDRVLVPEMNCGQLRLLLRACYLVDARGYNRVMGLPFTSGELEQAMLDELKDLEAS